MRKLRIAVITLAGGVPALTATLLAPGCGSEADTIDQPGDARAEVTIDSPSVFGDTRLDSPPPPPPECFSGSARVVELPEAGDAATPAQLCAVPQPTPTTTTARVTLTNYSPAQNNAKGFLALPPDLEATIVGAPSITVIQSRGGPDSINVTNLNKVAGGYEFMAGWDESVICNASMDVAATFEVACADGGTKTVESRTRLDLCDGSDRALEWVSSGDQCCECIIIAEMAPSPIVSDKKQDDLPLARVVRLRVLELARAGRQVLLLAENDAGPGLEIEWSISGGALERVAPDIMLWTLPDDDANPFGQVAVSNDAGAAVENFVWGAA